MTPKTVKYPINLMYHAVTQGVSPIPPGREVGSDIYDMPLDRFKEQMAWLEEQGCVIKTIGESGCREDVENSVVITFDDGEMSNYTDALPVLRAHDYKAYFFVIVNRVGREGYMGWHELRSMHEAGMVIGSHGLSHEALPGLLDSQIEQELAASKRALERNLEISVDTLSIPRGFCDDRVLDMAYAVGYKHVFISERPWTLKSHCLDRVAVKSSWSMKRFQMAISGQVPLREAVSFNLRQSAKMALRGRGYNLVRSALIKVWR